MMEVIFEAVLKLRPHANLLFIVHSYRYMPHSIQTLPSAAFMDHIPTMLSADVIIGFSFPGRLAPVPLWLP